MDRRHLPLTPERSAAEVPTDHRDQSRPHPQPDRVRAPQGAPNVLIVLIDDMGFGASSAFGGPCPMPTAEALADDGLRYSRFHTAAMCSPTRQALMTGRNHHSVGMGHIIEYATSAPGYHGVRPPSAATLAQTLSANGYATAAFGKWHQTPSWEQTAAGPFDRWPTREGFDHFYGILSAEASQFAPTLVDGTTFVDPPATEEEGYHLSEDLVDRTIAWIDRLRTADADKPWFGYLSFGATHAPFHLPASWRGRHRGAFSHGWDAQREITLARQKELGVVPPEAELAPWVGDVPHWDELSDTQRLVAERLMETYAAFAEHTDAQVGRLIEALRERGELDDTLVLYILGDNGASAEGGIDGTLNETLRLNGFDDTAERIAEQLDDIGGPDTFAHYPVGWALALDTPYQWTKQVASHYGGTRNGLIVHWPARIGDAGEVRHQWHHVIDVLPTILEVSGVPAPESVNGVPQDPIEGTSFGYSFDDAEAPDRHTTQYFELFGNRGIYHEGWTAVAQHRTPWKWVQGKDLPRFEDDVWELYDTRSDWTQAQNIADRFPEKLAELQELFHREAVKYKVYPLDDRGRERVNAEFSGRTTGFRGDTIVLTPAHARLREDAVPDVKNTSFRLSAVIDVAGDDADGVLVAQGARYAGWSFYLKRGVPVFAYNLVGLQLTHIRGAEPVGPGRHVVEYVFDYDGGGLGRGGTGSLLVDGREVGHGRVERTVPFFFSMDETLNVGIDRGSPITDDYSRDGGNPFTGELETVTIERGDDAVRPTDGQRLEALQRVH